MKSCSHQKSPRIDPASAGSEVSASDDRRTLVKESRQVLLNSVYSERLAQVDRSGSFLAYESEATGRRELHLTTFPQPGETWQVSRSGVDYSMWDPAADRLLYVQAGRLFEVAVTLQPEVSIGQAREVFDERPTRVVLSQFADMTPDGRGFVAVQRPPMAEAPLGRIVVYQNWFEAFREPRRQ